MNSADFTEFDLQNANRKIWMFAKEGDLQGIQNIILAMMRVGWLWEVNFNWQDHLVGHTALMRAAMERHVDVVKYLVDNGADVNVLAKNGASALINATASGNDEIVFYLVDHGANVNVIAKGTTETALLKAAESGRIESVKYLFVHGAGIEIKNENGVSPLMAAADNGHMDVVHYLLENGADVNSRNKSGSTALILAAKKGAFDIVRMLVEFGANMNIRHRQGATALMEAARKGHEEVVSYLVERGADVNFPHKDGGTVLTIAVEKGHLGIVRCIVELSGLSEMSKSSYVRQSQGFSEQDDFLEELDPQVLMSESASDHGLDENFPRGPGGDPSSASSYRPYEKSRRVDINVQNKRGATSLMIATVLGYLDIAKYLIDKGADLNVRSKVGETVLMIASAVPDRLEIVRYLVEKGANINIQDDNGETALMKTFHTGSIDVIKHLIDNGANVNLQNKRLDTVLHLFASNHVKFPLSTVWYIVEHGSDFGLLSDALQVDLLLRAIADNDLYVVDFYVARGCDMNMQNSDGTTPLMVAAEKRLLEVMRRLTSLGVNVDLQNKFGRTALMMAAKEGHNKIIEFLLDNSADELLQDQDGRTALCYTIELRKQESFELLLRLRPYQTAALRGSPPSGQSSGSSGGKRIYWQTRLRTKEFENCINVCDCLASALRSAREYKTCNIHLVGSSMVGKSILYKWLRSFLRPKSMLKKMFPTMKANYSLDPLEDRTRGIDSISVLSKNTTNYVIHDYSGNDMMHTSFAPILSRDSSVYVIVLSMWSVKSGSFVKKQDLIGQLLYWMRIIYSLKRGRGAVSNAKQSSSSTLGIPLVIVFNRFTVNTRAEYGDQHCIDLYNEILSEVKKSFKINAFDGLLGKDVDFVLQSLEPLIIDCTKRQDSYLFYQKIKSLSQYCPSSRFQIPLIVDYVMKNYHLLASSLKLIVESSVFDSALKDMLPGFSFSTKAFSALDSTPFQTLLLDILRKLCRLALKERFFICELPSISKSQNTQDKLIVKPNLLFSGIIGEILLQLQKSSILPTSNGSGKEGHLMSTSNQLSEDLKLDKEQLFQLLQHSKVSKYSKEHRHLSLKEYLQRNAVLPGELLMDLHLAIQLPANAHLANPTVVDSSQVKVTIVTKQSGHKAKHQQQIGDSKMWLYPFISQSMPRTCHLIKTSEYDKIASRVFSLPLSDKMVLVPGYLSKLFAFVYSQFAQDHIEVNFWTDGMIMKTKLDSVQSRHTGHRIFSIRPYFDTTGVLSSGISDKSSSISAIGCSSVIVSVASLGLPSNDVVTQALNSIREFLLSHMWGIKMKEFSVEHDNNGNVRALTEARELDEGMKMMSMNKNRIEFGQFMLEIKD